MLDHMARAVGRAVVVLTVLLALTATALAGAAVIVYLLSLAAL